MSLLRTLLEGMKTKLGREVAKGVAKQALVEAGEKVRKGVDEVEGTIRKAHDDYTKKQDEIRRNREAEEAAKAEEEALDAELEALKRRVEEG